MTPNAARRESGPITRKAASKEAAFQGFDQTGAAGKRCVDLGSAGATGELIALTRESARAISCRRCWSRSMT